MKIKAITFILLVLFFLKTNAQCAMCRAVLENGSDQAAAEGINNGIVYLMAIPYIVIGGLGFYIYKKYSKTTKTAK